MFQELKAMLRKGDQVTVTIAIENDTQLRVNVFPKLFTLDGENGEDRKALNAPLTITAPPDELDSPAFIAALNKFTESNISLRNTLDEVTAQHKAATDAARSKRLGGPGQTGKAAAALKAPAAAAKPEPAPAEEEEESTESLGL